MVCDKDNCGPNLVCVEILPGQAPVCVNEVPPGQYCDGEKNYDPCPSGFSCDRTYTKNCIPSSPFAGYNDGCLDDTYCQQGLSCKKGLCKETNYTQCRSDTACPVNKYCNLTQGIQPGVVGICLDLPGNSQSCATSGECQDGYSCNVDAQVCFPLFTLGIGSNCSSTEECSAGLLCYQNPDTGSSTCVNPNYHFVGGITMASWAYECIPGLPGCSCNQISNIFQYYKESTINIFSKSCTTVYNTYQQCLDSNVCKASLGDNSCLRKNCYNQYKNLYKTCYDASLIPTFCGASSIILIFGLLLLALLV